MLSLFPQSHRVITRRSALVTGSLSASSFLIPRTVTAVESSSAVLSHPPTAKRCISIFLCGGPSQPDLWDLKPNAPSGIRSYFDSISTSVPGLHFGELIPQVARHAGKLALIRSMTHSNNDHNGAIAHTLMAQLPRILTDFYVSRRDHPGVGGILQKLLGESGDLPAWVVLPRPFTTNSPIYKGQSGGFLGPAYDPLMFHQEAKGSLTDAPLKLDSVQLTDDVSDARLSARRQLLHRMSRALPEKATNQFDGFYDKSFQLLSDAATSTAFDLGQESVSLRDRYGRNEYGQSFLMARRLVEAGVRFVNVFWTFFDTKGCQFNLWDNHGVASDVCGIDGQLTGRQQLTHQYCTPSFDRSFSALLEDLDDRGLLDETLVTVAGEFGRTPKINATDGRDHWAHCYTNLMAGGGVRGGTIYGASDAHGAFVKDNPVTPEDFAATILHAFGLSPEAAIPDEFGRPVRITSGTPVTAIFG
ncbi:MAG: DUF1501 domain-containing protein [Planctomycetaceae bacterium]